MANAEIEKHTGRRSALTAERAWRYGPLILWMVFISIFSTAGFSSINTSRFLGPLLRWLFPGINDSQLGTLHFFLRKAGHFTEYAILAFLVRRPFVTSHNAFLRRYWFELGLTLIACYALLDELHQSFVPSRTASIYDSAIDVAGGLIVLLFLKAYQRSVKGSAKKVEKGSRL